ncbi:hypothetical protein [Chryseobacterium populi]|uniref:DUF3139 domain-containing protein n=1 Tax=Chryseobacterium populi TaxID=1144316 RepID=J3CEL1_9FLAO|nr:hypothetical protein [Chryseobacterium populi]EJL70064.1 hypothetical protein PMI13_02919 [Chryseobacterium populi]
MKKIIIIIVSILLLIVIAFTVYWNLPIEMTRKSDIKFGNELIGNIENYEKTYKKLPENNDWKTLEKLGFKKEEDMMMLKPEYKTDNNATYELIYTDGFDGPYLIWNSKEKKWTIDFSKIEN